MISENPSLNVYINIVGYLCRPSEIDLILGEKASECFLKGECIAGSKIKAKENSSRYFAGKLSSLDLNDHVLRLKKRFSRVERFRQLPKNSDVELVCVVSLESRDVCLTISNEGISFLAAINAHLGIDYYL